MKYQTFFVIALIVVSGFIAYFGDLLGRKMGKKRLTLLNLRPRYTAIVVTTITGMLISALALVIFISVNQEFAEIMRRGDEILSANKQYEISNLRLIRRNRELTGNRDQLKAEVEIRQKEVIEARKDAAEAKLARNKAQATVTKLEKNIAAKQSELESLRKRTDITESELKLRTQELDTVRGQLTSAQAQLTKARSDVDKAVLNLHAAILELSEKKDRLKEAEDKLKERESQLAKAELLNADLTMASAVGRSKEPILRQGEELWRGIIAPSDSKTQMRGALDSLLDQASREALDRGAKIGDNKRAVLVVYRQIVTQAGKQYAVLDDDEPSFVNAAIDTISKSPQDVMVQMVSAINSFPGDQAYVELRLYVNLLVYPQDKKIASTTIDGRLSEGRILLLLIDFLQKQVAENAVQAGIVPASNSNLRTSPDPNAREQVEELMSALDQIKAVGGRARVDLVASKDIRAADTINIKNVRINIAKAE